MPMILRKIQLMREAAEVCMTTYEKRIIANSTKYATLASNGRAVLSDRMIVYPHK